MNHTLDIYWKVLKMLHIVSIKSLKVNISCKIIDLSNSFLQYLSDDTMKTDFISFTGLLALGCKSKYNSQYVGSGASSQEHELHQH